MPALTESFSLYQEQSDLLTQVAKDYGLGRSAALRYIITDWARLRNIDRRDDGASPEPAPTDPEPGPEPVPA